MCFDSEVDHGPLQDGYPVPLLLLFQAGLVPLPHCHRYASNGANADVRLLAVS